ncbi:MAG TPA: single-stranded DNA-binding protein [Nocardioidaceae bacterium]|nr:single-stranded DNA-binding protein [Nocardioidaceae bacterium]
MSDTFVTFHGWVGNDVVHRDPKGISVANFRVASTPRIKRNGEWMDGDTTWYSVTAWRGLADNIRDSVSKGDAVIVHGRLRTESWVREDKQLSNTLVVEASLVGHDLSRGTSTFIRSSRQDRGNETDVHEEISDMVHRDADERPQVDPWGQPKSVPGEEETAAEANPFAQHGPAA